MNFKNIKVIFVDWYITLTSLMFLNKLKLEHPDLFEKINNEIFHNQDAWHLEWARGKLNYHDAAQRLEQTGIAKKSEIEAIFKDSCSHQSIDFPEILDMFLTLRKHNKKVVLATDNWDIFEYYTIPSMRLDRYFDEIISSHKEGYLKRDIVNSKLPFFERYLKENGFSYQDAILIDDSLVTQQAAKACKLPVFEVKNSKETLDFIEKFLRGIENGL